MKSCATLWVIFLALLLIFGGVLLFYPLGFIYATYENLYGEWLQFSAFAGIAIYSFLIVKKRRSQRRWFWVLLGLAAFYTAMEEISWGQQIFGWQSAEVFQKKNLQGETNLHNFFTGPYSTLIKDLLTYALALGMLAYGVVYPLLLKANFGLAARAQRLGMPAPSLGLIPFFLAAAFCEMSFFHFNEAELAELLVGLAMLFVAVDVFHGPANTAHADRTVALRLGVAFGIAVVAAIALTQMSIRSDYSRERVANRIEAGIKKFAGRYARIGAWDHAIQLYQRHLAYDPNSRSRRRRLADAYESAGRDAERERVLQEALALDLALLETEPWRASLHRSLTRTYRELGEEAKAREHIGEALRINETRVKEHPRSAAAAYSLARTYDLLGRNKAAIAQYRRAFQLKPGSSKYRRAYREAVDD